MTRGGSSEIGEDWDIGEVSRQEQDRAGPAAVRVGSSKMERAAGCSFQPPVRAAAWLWEGLLRYLDAAEKSQSSF